MVIGKILFVVGLSTTFVTQIMLIYLSFKVRAIHGLFCLFGTPIIVFISNELRNNSRIRAVSIIWVMSLIVWLSGLFLISAG
jgi:hypothetical protein